MRLFKTYANVNAVSVIRNSMEVLSSELIICLCDYLCLINSKKSFNHNFKVINERIIQDNMDSAKDCIEVRVDVSSLMYKDSRIEPGLGSKCLFEHLFSM